MLLASTGVDFICDFSCKFELLIAVDLPSSLDIALKEVGSRRCTFSAAEA